MRRKPAVNRRVAPELDQLVKNTVSKYERIGIKISYPDATLIIAKDLEGRKRGSL